MIGFLARHLRLPESWVAAGNGRVISRPPFNKGMLNIGVYSGSSSGTKVIMGDPFLNHFALGLLIFLVVYAVIAIHDFPYKIAEVCEHPYQDAIHAAGWVSLFTLQALWPFLWIWAMVHRPERGWGFAHRLATEIDGLERADWRKFALS
jgi:hypothetical protein